MNKLLLAGIGIGILGLLSINGCSLPAAAERAEKITTPTVLVNETTQPVLPLPEAREKRDEVKAGVDLWDQRIEVGEANAQQRVAIWTQFLNVGADVAQTQMTIPLMGVGTLLGMTFGAFGIKRTGDKAPNEVDAIWDEAYAAGKAAASNKEPA